MDLGPFREELDTFVQQRSFLGHFVLPDYGLFNVRNISSIVGKIFDVDSLVLAKFPEDYIDDSDGVEKVLMVIFDGLGYNRLISHIERFRGVLYDIVEKGVLKPSTTTFPATTSTSLTSIYTALPPSEHGIIGFLMFVKDYGLIFNTLNMRPVYGYDSGVNVVEEFSRKIAPWSSSLREHGVEAATITRGTLMGSGLSRVIHRDQKLISYVLESDMIIQCRKALQQREPAFLTMYYSGFDALTHVYGPQSEEATSEIQFFESLLKNLLLDRLSADTKKKTLILLTADHGVSETSRVYFLKDLHEVNENLLIPPVGDSRASFLFPKYGYGDKLRKAFERNVEGFVVMPSKELMEKGAFGPVKNPGSLEAILGDLTALSMSKNAVFYPYFDDDRARSPLGSHGGMTADEIIVPSLSARLSKL